MTNPNDLRRAESHGVDTDRMDGGNRLWRPVTLAIAAGLATGAVVGGLYGASQDASYEATTALSVLPDSVVDTGQQNTAAPSLDATAYIQGQLVSLNGTEVANTVRSRLKLSSAPSITATQVGQTYVVDVTATAATEAQARRVATTTGTVYDQLRSTALTRSITASQRSTTARLATVRANLADAQKGVKPGTNITPAQTALQTEYERLLTLSSSLTLALPQVGQLVTVQSPAHVTPASLSPTALSAAVGALVGALLAVLLLALRRRTSPRVRTVGDIVDLGVPVLLPVVPRTSRRAKGAARWRSSPARLIAARLASQDSHRVLVVVGPTAGVGASHTAVALAAAGASRGPVLLVQTAEGDPSATDGTPVQIAASSVPGVWLLRDGARLAGSGAQYAEQADVLVDVVRRAGTSGWFVVIDAPPLAESDLALDCLTVADSVAALVVARGFSRPADVLSAAELFGAHEGSFAGVVLNDAPHGIRAIRHRAADDVTAQRGDAARTPAPVIGTAVAANGQHRPRPTKVYDNSVSIDELLHPDDPALHDNPAPHDGAALHDGASSRRA